MLTYKFKLNGGKLRMIQVEGIPRALAVGRMLDLKLLADKNPVR